MLSIAVKSSQQQVPPFLRIAQKFGISSFELFQNVIEISQVPIEKRVERLARLFKGKIKWVCFHSPLWTCSRDPFECDLAGEKNKIILTFARETILEAGMLSARLSLEKPTFVIVHFIGLSFYPSITEKLLFLERKKKVLKELKDYIQEVCSRFGLMKNNQPMIKLVVENNPPLQRVGFGLIDMHPYDFCRTPLTEVCLDFSHFQLTLNYWSFGRGESKGSELDRKIYCPPDWTDLLDTFGQYIQMIHLNDAVGYSPSGEGLPLGRGEINFPKVLQHKCFQKECFATIEIKDQHRHPEFIMESLEYLQRHQLI